MALGDRAAARREPLAQLRLAHQAAQRLRYLAAVAGLDHERVLALDRDVARPRRRGATRSAAARPPRPRAASRRTARSCSRGRARGRRRTRRRARSGAAGPGSSSGTPSRCARARSSASSGPLPRISSSASPSREARLRERVDQHVEVLVGHEPADRSTRTGAPSARAIAPARRPREPARGPRSAAQPPPAPASTPSARSRSTPCEPATMNPAARGASSAVHAPLQPRQPGVAPGGQLAEDESGTPTPARPRERAHRGRPVLPADHAVRPRALSGAPDPARHGDGVRPARAALPGRQHLAGVASCDSGNHRAAGPSPGWLAER